MLQHTNMVFVPLKSGSEMLYAQLPFAIACQASSPASCASVNLHSAPPLHSIVAESSESGISATISGRMPPAAARRWSAAWRRTATPCCARTGFQRRARCFARRTAVKPRCRARFRTSAVGKYLAKISFVRRHRSGLSRGLFRLSERSLGKREKSSGPSSCASRYKRGGSGPTQIQNPNEAI